MGFIEPNFSRNENDLMELEAFQKTGYENLNSEQKAKWNSGMQGALNAADLNRIENNFMFLLNAISPNAQTSNYKTDWKVTDFILLKDFLRIYRNILDLMYVFELSDETPQPPYDTIDKLNKVEELANRSYEKISPFMVLDSFKTKDNEYFKTSNGEYLKVPTNTLIGKLKTKDDEYFLTNQSENFMVLTKPF